MLSAKDMFEATKSRNSKARDEKLEFVQAEIQKASEKELFSTSFGFLQLKPFVGVVIEKLNELGYKVAQVGTNITVSWDLTPKSEARPAIKSADYGDDVSSESGAYYDDSDDDNDEDEYNSRF